MKPALINHPFRTIRFNYMSEAALSEFETRLMMEYQALHDEMERIKQHLLQLNAAVEKKQQQIKAPVEGYENLKSEIKKYEYLLGIAADMPKEGEHKIDPQDIQTKLNEFDLVRDAYWIDVEHIHSQYNEAFKNKESVDGLFDQFEKQYAGPLFKNHERMEIDIVCFDDDQNEFKDCSAKLNELFNTATTRYETWLQAHNTMATNIKKLYAHIEKIFNYINKMQHFNTGKKGDQFSKN